MSLTRSRAPAWTGRCPARAIRAESQDYIETGWAGNYGQQSASDQVQLTADATSLADHFSGPDASNTMHVEEDWSFTGSG